MRSIPAIFGLLALGLCAPALALNIAGSSTVQPVVEKLIPLSEQAGGEPIRLAGGGSGAGIRQARSGEAQIGMVSRDLSADEKSTLQNRVIGIDALAIVVNRSNPVPALSKAQLIDLYAGKVNNWKEIGGPDRPVVRVSKEVGRSTLELFEHYTGLVSPDRKQSGKPQISPQALIVGANVEALTLAGGLPGAIAYVSVGTARALAEAGMPIRIVPLDGVDPTDEAIAGGRYAIVRPLNLVFTSETPAVKAFVDLALSPPGQDVVRSLGFLPASR